MKSILAFGLVFLHFATLAQVIPIAPMNFPRMAHQATALQNGDVLVTGGYGDGDYHASAERWDQANDQWNLVDDMEVPRWSHTATLLENGKVLVAGGWDGQNANHMSTEIFNPDLNVWEEGPDMSVGRTNHRAIRLTGGQVLIIGGYNGTEDQVSCDLYDPESNTITPTGDLNFGRSSFTETKIGDGRVIVTGGFNPNYNFQMVECEVYSAFTGEWTNLAPLLTGTDNHAAVMLTNNELLVSGGRIYNAQNDWFAGQDVAAIYTIDDDEWYEIAMDKGHSYHAMHDMVWYFIIPGSVDITGNGVTTNTTTTSEFDWSYEWNDWSEIPGRYRYSSCTLIDGSFQMSVLVCGGEDDSTAEIYEWTNNVDELEIELSLYPNPARDQLYISSSQPLQTIRVYNAQGKLQDLPLSNNKIMDIGGLTPGMYILKGLFGESLITRKFIVN